MLKQAKRPLAWTAVYLILLLAVMSPFNVLAMVFLMVPLSVMTVQLSAKTLAAHTTVVVLIAALIAGQSFLLLVMIALFFGIPAVAMGYLYKKNTPARTVIMTGGLVLLAEMLISFALGAAFGFEYGNELRRYMETTMEQMPLEVQTAFPEGWLDERMDMIIQMLPLYMIETAFIFSIITHVLARRILIKLGMQIPAFKKIRDWMLPKSLVWYFLTALVLSFFVTTDTNSGLSVILLNLLPLLTLAFSIQAVSFLFFVAHIKGWNRALPIVGIVGCLLLPSLMSILGVFDVAFGIRNRLNNTNV